MARRFPSFAQCVRALLLVFIGGVLVRLVDNPRSCAMTPARVAAPCAECALAECPTPATVTSTTTLTIASTREHNPVTPSPSFVREFRDVFLADIYPEVPWYRLCRPVVGDVDCVRAFDFAPLPQFFSWSNDITEPFLRQRRGGVANALFGIFTRATPSGHRRIFIDIGANSGFFSTMAASASYSVYAFEPQPSCASRLHASLAVWRNQTGQHPNVSVITAAVSDASGVMHVQRLSKCDQNWQLHSTTSTEVTAVPIVTSVGALNSILTTDRPFSQAVVKIDVEGHEEAVLGPLLADTSLQHVHELIFERVKMSDTTAVAMCRGLVHAGFILRGLPGEGTASAVARSMDAARDLSQNRNYHDIWASRNV